MINTLSAFSILTEYSMVDFGLGPKEEVWGDRRKKLNQRG
jgi:hypothetical protein